uniref:Uncharacterized protein n=1 Tax=Solanum lycopersicum TaxID=4081 RepID=A0A3Q7G3C4_SOLLC
MKLVATKSTHQTLPQIVSAQDTFDPSKILFEIFLTKYLPTTSQNVYAWTSIYLELRMIKLGHYLDAAVELKVPTLSVGIIGIHYICRWFFKKSSGWASMQAGSIPSARIRSVSNLRGYNP